MINLNKKYTFGLFLALFIKSNFSVSGCEIRIFNPDGQECIEDKNRKLYPIWRLGPNTSEDEKEIFKNKFSYNNRTEKEKEIIYELIEDNKLDENIYRYKFVFGFNIEYGYINLFRFLNNTLKYNNFIVIEDSIENIKYIAGLISFKKLEKELPLALNIIVKKENIFYKKIIEIEFLSICENLQKNGLGSVLLNKLNINKNINYLISVNTANNFYKKNGYKQIDNSCYFYKINEDKKIPIFNKINNPILNIYGIQLKNLKLELGFNIFEDKNNEINNK